ncbi:hypothetical protein FL966_10670 [Caproiciproducens galactitolivorans]|uniref:Uncharacterized protein n=1 Tax=Caproiciproducens galactitolivorans TaxID=642589 RepID=A0A4Z0YEC3_9FIRM|nr:hypothetical protein [Caproiciproducens galactitolivorans]QEY35479.1 hypothetical protein FL966_10670 [Caproiciproducens galactitolivorans]TGJ77193.1 hypothetical protein CAGA_05610 [Caproiciproducens galactitolivorans]
MKYIGVTPEGEFPLPPPVSAKLVMGEDAPADGFTGVFPLVESGRRICAIRIYGQNGTLRFDGITDEQKESCGAGRTLTLAARSRAALLLDNEAIPQTYCMPSLETIFTRHIKPYGFSGFRGERRSFSGELTVTKGMSEWQAAEGFCTRFLGRKPRILEGIFDASGEILTGEMVFDNSGGIPYSAAFLEYRYCDRISEILIKPGKSGAYGTAVKDEEALSLGIRRKRCLAEGNTNADAKIRAARHKSFRAVVDCPGEICAHLLQSARVRDPVLGNLDGLYIAEIEYRLDSSGERSRYILRR